MDKADLAVIISVLSLVAAAASAFFTGRLARNDARRMRRREIIVETSLSAGQSTLPGWQRADVTVRNLEPVGVLQMGIATSARGALLLQRDTPISPEGAEDTVPEGATKRLSFGIRLEPAGTLSRRSLPADRAKLKFWVHGPCRPDQIHVEWRWADGKKS